MPNRTDKTKEDTASQCDRCSCPKPSIGSWLLGPWDIGMQEGTQGLQRLARLTVFQSQRWASHEMIREFEHLPITSNSTKANIKLQRLINWPPTKFVAWDLAIIPSIAQEFLSNTIDVVPVTGPCQLAVCPANKSPKGNISFLGPERMSKVHWNYITAKNMPLSLMEGALWHNRFSMRSSIMQ